MTARDDGRLEGGVEARLRRAGVTAAWPATPDLRGPVLARISTAAPSAPRATVPRPRPAFRVARAMVVALVALLILAGVAAGLGIRLPGLEVLFVDRLPPVGTGSEPGSATPPAGTALEPSPTPPAGAGLELGSPVALADATALDQPRVLVPASLPEPDGAYQLGVGDQRIVTLAYRATGDQATLAGSDLSLTVAAVPGNTNATLLRKLIGAGTTVEPASVGDSAGWWISGAPHEVLILRPGGEVAVLTSALAGDTLLFARDGTLYRLESALGREATVAVAESMR